MKIYKDKKTELDDVKSTGWALCTVGGIGIVILILININVIPINLDTSAKLISSIVMGILFLVFLGIGIKSFLSLKTTEKLIDEQKEMLQSILNQFYSSYDKEYFLSFENFSDENIEVSAEEDYNNDTDENETVDNSDIYFIRTERISELLMENNPDLSEDMKEYLIEQIYSQIFAE